jgi:hypothetical protein
MRGSFAYRRETAPTLSADMSGVEKKQDAQMAR